ncbi:hypothetical protein [Bradyrhizobium pachyrhizi]|uniref:hypothetical protein n=1 Tax=Bradyrhizobium pachyrhizi TaxID=280333 RepID=UPI00128F40EA|nr:hypothetical protein [Bradyrhizobium pachyrhizi]
MSISLGCSAINPTVGACASIARSSAVMTDGGYSARADTAAIDAQMHQPAPAAFGFASDFAVLLDTMALIDGGLFFNPKTCKSRGLSARHHALLHRRRNFAHAPMRASADSIEPLAQP